MLETAILYTELNEGEQLISEPCLFDRNTMTLPEYTGLHVNDIVLVSQEYIVTDETEEYFRVYPEDVVYIYEEILGEYLDDEYGNGIVTYNSMDD